MLGFACLLFAVAVAAEADPNAAVAKRLDAYVSAHVANNDFSGIVLVTRGGKRVFDKTAGLASRRFDVPIRPNTRFLVASVTKTFTAASIALLQAEGKLKIEDTLDGFLPNFPNARKIYLWHLLAHQAGLANPDYDEIAARSVTPDDLLARIAAKPPLFEPGSQTRYSNAGYIVLAHLVEKIGGSPFGAFLHDRIFAPLKMADSGTLQSGEIVPRLAEGYVPDAGDGFLVAEPHDPSSLFGSGNVYASAGDLDRWLAAIDRHTLFDIAKQPYPFGWGQRKWFEKDVLVQSGFTNGYSSIILTVPSEELHLVVLMNTQSGFIGDEGKALLGIVLGGPAIPPPRRAPAAKVSRERLMRYAGLYLWGEGKVPMHLESDGSMLRLRWADSADVVPLTPVSETEFLDRTSFGRIHFTDDGLTWTQNGEETRAPRVKD
jgi:CubicO group peptidase (beta-lactamase class C family)